MHTALQCCVAPCFMFVITLKGASHFMMHLNRNSRTYSQRHELFSRCRAKSCFFLESVVCETSKSAFHKNKNLAWANTFNTHRHTCRHVFAVTFCSSLNSSCQGLAFRSCLSLLFHRLSLQRWCSNAFAQTLVP